MAVITPSTIRKAIASKPPVSFANSVNFSDTAVMAGASATANDCAKD